MWSTVKNDPSEREAFFSLLDEYLERREGGPSTAATPAAPPAASLPRSLPPRRAPPAGLTTVEPGSSSEPEQASKPPIGTGVANAALKNTMFTNAAFRAAGASPVAAAAASHAAAAHSERLAPHVASAANASIRDGSWRQQKHVPAGLMTSKAGIGKTMLSSKGPMSKEEARKNVFQEQLATRQTVLSRGGSQSGPPPLAPRRQTGLGSARADYDYNGTEADDLTVKEGDVLTVLEHVSDEWWRCRSSDGREGLVPATYVSAI